MAHSGNPTLCFPDGLVSITCQSRLVEVGSLPGVCFKIIYMDLLKSNSEVLASAGMFISTSCLSDFFFLSNRNIFIGIYPITKLSFT